MNARKTMNNLQKKEAYQSKDQSHSRRKALQANPKGKPAMEIYRPPTLRGYSTIFDSNGEMFATAKHNMNNFAYHDNFNFHNNHTNHNRPFPNNHKFGNKPGLNIHAKEFISLQNSSPILHSKSSTSVMLQGRKSEGLQHSKSGHNIRGGGSDTRNDSSSNNNNSTPTKIRFKETAKDDPDAKIGMTSRPSHLEIGPAGPQMTSLKRSKSLGSADLRHMMDSCQDPLSRLGPFSSEALKAISDSLNDPNKLTARQLMEVVQLVLSRALEASRHSEPASRICTTIIEKEKGETFLETLLNTCQEFYQERDRLLRSPVTSHPVTSHAPAVSHPRWVAYMSFLSEMYTQIKRRHTQLMTQRIRNSETSPGLLLLTLLAQCCYVCLKDSSVNCLPEAECLFFVMTAVGKDMEVKLPSQMAKVIGAARDAFLTGVYVPEVRKTLLQLIEMNASRWHLPAPAVMYYYPGCGAK